MSLFKKISESFGKGKLKKEQREQFWEILRNAVLDGEITNAELSTISDFFVKSELNEKEFIELKDAMFWQVVQTAIADRRITEQEQNALQRMAAKLQISQYILDQSQKEISYFALLDSISRGILPVTQPNGVVLQKNEVAYVEIPSTLLEERVVGRRIVGHSQGVSFRIMKGVTYRVGGNRGTMVSDTGIVPVSNGNFVITNKRLIFAGNSKSFSFDFKKLIDIQLYSDALKFSVTSRQKPVIVGMHTEKALEVSGMIISHILNN